MQTSKRFFVYASLGINAGDDLMNMVLVGEMCRHPRVEAVVTSVVPGRTDRLLRGQARVISSRYPAVLQWIRSIRSSHAVLIGGGTIIQGDPASRLVSGILLKAVVIAGLGRVFRIPIFCVGIGVNPLARGIDRLLGRFLVSWSRKIYVRDEASRAAAQLLAGSNRAQEAQINVMPDLAFGFERPLLVQRDAQAASVYVSVVGESHRSAADTVLKAVVPAAIDRGLHVVLVAMDARPEEELAAYRRFIRFLPDQQKQMVSVYLVENPEELIGRMRPQDIAFGMRLHFCIAALICGINPVIVSREPKTLGLRRYSDRLTVFDSGDEKLGVLLLAEFSERATALSSSLAPMAGEEKVALSRNQVHQVLAEIVESLGSSPCIESA